LSLQPGTKNNPIGKFDMKHLIRYLKIALKIVVGIFIAYAILFSVTASILIGIAAYIIITPVVEVRNLKTSNPPETLYMRECRNSLSKEHSPDSLEQISVPLDSISPVLVKAVLAAEDDGFYIHPGFDINAILIAMEHNRTSFGPRHGASTITQQVAKNLFTGGERSFTRKYKELAYALLMEHILGKDRILELYMNYAQWGPNIFGCEAASLEYFKKPCKNLTVSQAAHLAAVLAKPSRLNPNATQSLFLQKRLTVIANNMFRRRSIDTALWKELGGQADSAYETDTTTPSSDTLLNQSEKTPFDTSTAEQQ
jgi:monofunctional biosynthetic peptidoglycan transglycosylase